MIIINTLFASTNFLNLLRILSKHIFIFLILVDDGKIQNRPQYRGLFHAFTSIFKQEGATGLYKGVSPNVFGAGAAWGSYFLLYVLIDNIVTIGLKDVVIKMDIKEFRIFLS